jgi:single-strand DNA-binding protein
MNARGRGRGQACRQWFCVVQDTELKYTQKGAAVCSIALASNRYYKQDEETQKEVSFFEVTTWSHLAEVCGE